jgi:hypothetical protein
MNPELKLKELFKKHLDLSTNRPQAKIDPSQEPVNDRIFEDCFYHNMEYLIWEYDEPLDKLNFYGPYYSKPRSLFTLYDIFCGQDDKIEVIKQDFLIYIKKCIADLSNRIVKASSVLREQDVPPANIYLKPEWDFILNNCQIDHIFGMPVNIMEYENINKIESAPQFGRFVLFE